MHAMDVTQCAQVYYDHDQSTLVRSLPWTQRHTEFMEVGSDLDSACAAITISSLVPRPPCVKAGHGAYVSCEWLALGALGALGALWARSRKSTDSLTP